jgi:SAM-dependent methyltransferase
MFNATLRFGIFCLAIGCSLLVKAQGADVSELRAYGPGGPLEPIRECARAFSNQEGVQVTVTGGPEEQWIAQARKDADVVFGGADYMLTRVLDVCCGTGSSAIPAAELVGASGFVIGVDLADRLLTLAREKARQRALQNIAFRVADMLELDSQAASFDVVLCVFGIFFVPDMAAAVRELWRFVRPGGKLAITSWGRNVLEPADSVFWRSVWRLRPELPKPSEPWDRIADPEGLRQMLRKGGVEAEEVIAENTWHPIRSPEDWWTIVLGSVRRAAIEQLTPTELTAVKEANLAFIRDHRITTLETNALHAIATKESN